jgi:2-polyprenyl-6-methoxyphenol hydroxylase-like FAD-dependent oxidoreductase
LIALSADSVGGRRGARRRDVAWGVASELFEKRRRARVEKLQENSRTLARWMFVANGIVARIRDVALRFYTMEQALRPIVEAMNEPI